MSRIADSEMYGHLWGTAELRSHFSESGRLSAWLRILVALAEAQAANGIIPGAAAAQIRSHAEIGRLDLNYVADETRRTSHSTLGLIQGLKRILPDSASPYVYYGATVQDLTDTWTALTMKQVGTVVWRDLGHIERGLIDLARTHRSTVMAGRTHGQIGSVITFGFKAASWADEIRRHTQRLLEGRSRWQTGQLAGSVGTMAFMGARATAVRADFCHLLGLSDPVISWTSSRDRITEFASVLSMIATTLARIGDEVYELQRPEIGELGEDASGRAVGSITMPHKQNPEGAEHLVTLERLIRSHAGLLAESALQGHERDGRGWKVEWIALPEVCLLVGAALAMARELISGLEVNPATMRRNLDRIRGYWVSELVLRRVSASLGKHAAQETIHAVLRRGWANGLDAKEALLAEPDLAALVSPADLDEMLAHPDIGSATFMVDATVARAEAAWSSEPTEWL
jgi:adenylosuccinate lyase